MSKGLPLEEAGLRFANVVATNVPSGPPLAT
jgi:hypothetical protein